MISPLLAISAVTKTYGRTVVLKDLSFSAGAHELVVVLGPNGAGKSTLVQLLTGLFVPDEGSIKVCGHDMQSAPVQALREVGVVFQQQTLDPELSVAGNLRFHTDLHGLDRRMADARIEEMLSRFGLAVHARDKARVLSGGNRRRLELARALLHNPAVLIMDEPTVGLDPQSRQALIEHVLELKRRAELLVLWTTHLIDEAEQADRLLFLNEGSLAFDGTPAAALAASGKPELDQAFLAMTRRSLGTASF